MHTLSEQFGNFNKCIFPCNYYHNYQDIEYFCHHKLLSHATLMSVTFPFPPISGPSQQYTIFWQTYISCSCSRISYKSVLSFGVCLIWLGFLPWHLKMYFMCFYTSVFLYVLYVLQMYF